MSPETCSRLHSCSAPDPAGIRLRWILDPVLLTALGILVLAIGRRPAAAMAARPTWRASEGRPA
jgi:hypothetical protein